MFASWLSPLRYADLHSDEPSTCYVPSCFSRFIKFCAYVDLLTLLSSASHNLWFLSPGLGWRLQNLPSQDINSQLQATIGRDLYPRDFLVESFPYRGFQMPRSCGGGIIIIIIIIIIISTLPAHVLRSQNLHTFLNSDSPSSLAHMKSHMILICIR